VSGIGGKGGQNCLNLSASRNMPESRLPHREKGTRNKRREGGDVRPSFGLLRRHGLGVSGRKGERTR